MNLADLIADDTHNLAWIRKPRVSEGTVTILPDGLKSYGFEDDLNGVTWELIEHSSLPVTLDVVEIPRVRIAWKPYEQQYPRILTWEGA